VAQTIRQMGGAFGVPLIGGIAATSAGLAGSFAVTTGLVGAAAVAVWLWQPRGRPDVVPA
jgi:hypothetical protein